MNFKYTRGQHRNDYILSIGPFISHMPLDTCKCSPSTLCSLTKYNTNHALYRKIIELLLFTKPSASGCFSPISMSTLPRCFLTSGNLTLSHINLIIHKEVMILTHGQRLATAFNHLAKRSTRIQNAKKSQR